MTSPLPGRAALPRCRAEMQMWRNFAALARFANPEHLPAFRAMDRRRLWPRPGWNRATTPAQIPRQRAAPAGLPRVLPRLSR